MRKEISKIQIPNVEKEYLNRPVDSLLASSRERVVVLNAGAGYGKTQVLANYVSRFGGKCAWYNLSETDNDFMSFVRNFSKSVMTAAGTAGEAFQADVSLQEDFDILVEKLVLWLDDQIDELNVVLDDFQEITNGDILNLVDVLIETMSEKIRFFIVVKRSLPLFLEECVAAGTAVCIGSEELKFQQSEIEILLDCFVVPEDRQKASELIWTTTEGWPVGVAQIMIQLRRQRKAVTLEPVKIICDKLEVTDYFMTQVYQMLPFDIQTFLKKTAVLDYMTPAVCNQIMGIYNSDGMLRYLVSEKLFVQSLGEGIGLYRYHSIFQRFLISQNTEQQRLDSLKQAAYYYLKKGDKIQAAEYARRAGAADIVMAVIEAYGEEMLKERLYETLRRWFEFLDTEHAALTAKAQLVFGKYLWELGFEAEAKKQINAAGKSFFQDGRMQDYKRVLLFVASSERKAGNLLQAEMCLKEADENREKYWGTLAEELCTEQVKYACCLQRTDLAAEILRFWRKKGAAFRENSFLAAADYIFCGGDVQTPPPVRIPGSEEGFLIQNCIRAERLKKAYREEDYEAVRREASGLIANAEHETLQTAIAWKMLSILSWKDGDYRKAVEQSGIGDRFLYRNQIQPQDFSESHQQIFREISLLKRGSVDSRYFISQKEEETEKEGGGNGGIWIRCLKKFCVYLPDEQEMKWRTKKAQELFAYLFHLQGAGVSREELIELLWPETGTKSATALFHTTLYSIRQAFVQAGWADLITYEKKKYALNMQMITSDLEELRSALENCGTDSRAAEQVIQLYAGGYMENTGYLWAYAVGKELENSYLQVCRDMADRKIAEEEYGQAVPWLQKMLERDPYDEAVITQLITCLFRCGKRSEARKEYDRLASLYKEDLGLDFEQTFQELVEG